VVETLVSAQFFPLDWFCQAQQIQVKRRRPTREPALRVRLTDLCPMEVPATFDVHPNYSPQYPSGLMRSHPVNAPATATASRWRLERVLSATFCIVEPTSAPTLKPPHPSPSFSCRRYASSRRRCCRTSSTWRALVQSDGTVPHDRRKKVYIPTAVHQLALKSPDASPPSKTPNLHPEKLEGRSISPIHQLDL